MAYVWLHDGTEIKVEPADLKTEQADIVLMLTTLAELRDAGALATPAPDRATCDRIARLVAPYVSGVTVEQLGAAFVVDPGDIMRVLRRVLLFFLYTERSS